MKEDVWAGKILQPCQYFLKQAECEYFVLVSTRDSFLSVNVNPLFYHALLASSESMQRSLILT